MKKTFIIFIFYILMLILSQRVQAHSSPPELEPDSQSREESRQPKEIIIVAVISIILFIAFYCIYLCCCIDDHIVNIGNWSRWTPINFVGSFRHSAKVSYGLDPTVVKSFPTFEYEAVKSKMIGKNTLECAVCLMEYNDIDVLRLIPKCDHVFHAECVDDWLVNHATCPVCRFNLTNADLWEYDMSQDDTIVEVGDRGNDNDNNQRVVKDISLSRSLSTGHMDRFTLRLPREVWKQIMMNGNKLEGNINLWVKSGESSTKAGYREGIIVEGSSRSKSERFVRNNAKVFSFRKHFTSKETSSISVVPIEANQLPV
ncbi:E3 ubiquitin-protein ligase ATL31-like [Chenopodium quinoa]|uniref:E3 ubiquitin-protein ligase ATL31-like n=1 Tax=Chenopodium quinoa TaxID=63459 RepID=UPI000B781615|nr:E3 ubiquitin-protein ligase ATL31-like [Chenopodium quinoa]